MLLAVELLLFEWKPRSLVPVALAGATAGAVRRYIIGLGPLFPTPPHCVFIRPEGLAGCIVAGILAGGLSALLTLAVYAAEDLFQKHVPIHWMWWPAIGGLAVGLGGIVFPQALGVGYDTIGALLQGDDLLRARVRDLEEERRLERILRIHLPFGGPRELEEEPQPSGVSSGSNPDSSGVSG